MSNHFLICVRCSGLVLLALLMAGLTMWIRYQPVNVHPTSVPRQARVSGPPLLQLERIGELAPVRVHVADVLIAEGEGLRGAWLIKGDALIVCDIPHGKLSDVDNERRTAKLHLPPLRVTSARVDFEKSKTWSVEKTSWLPWSTGNENTFRDAALFHAQQLVEQVAGSENNLNVARSQLVLLLRQFYNVIDWEITVTSEP